MPSMTSFNDGPFIRPFPVDPDAAERSQTLSAAALWRLQLVLAGNDHLTRFKSCQRSW